jgi:hypothetical protein
MAAARLMGFAAGRRSADRRRQGAAMPLRAILLLSLLSGCAWTVERPASPSGASPYLAGKGDAQQAFARQATTATQPSGANPGFIGSYLWGGRADEQYRPFFQWG